jgi:Tfp pilus assembly protein PilO
MEETRAVIDQNRFPRTAEVENLVLSLAQAADERGVRVTSSSSNRQQELLSGRSYNVVENSLEMRGRVDDLVSFMRFLEERTVETLEVRSINLRLEAGVWILTIQIRILTE